MKKMPNIKTYQSQTEMLIFTQNALALQTVWFEGLSKPTK